MNWLRHLATIRERRAEAVVELLQTPSTTRNAPIQLVFAKRRASGLRVGCRLQAADR